MALRRSERGDEPAQRRYYVLRWIDADLHDGLKDGKRVADYERERTFPHCGAAIAWARRQVFHGKVFGDAIEFNVMAESAKDYGGFSTSVEIVYDLSLSGFSKWLPGAAYYEGSFSASNNMSLDAPSRRLKVPQ
jgi:hypothetical protein